MEEKVTAEYGKGIKHEMLDDTQQEYLLGEENRGTSVNERVNQHARHRMIVGKGKEE